MWRLIRHRGSSRQLLAASGLESDETRKRDSVTKDLDGGNLRAKGNDGRRDEENVLEHTSEGEDKTRTNTDEENGSDVEGEGDTSVRKENEKADLVEVTEGSEALNERHDARVDDRADGGEVVERDKGVHLHAVKQDLDHDETRGLERDGGALTDEADQLEVNLTVGSESAAKGDHQDDGEQASVGLLDLESERDQENADRVERLEHLDEGNRERKVGIVRQNERAREEGTDGENRANPAVALTVSLNAVHKTHSHLNVLGAIDEGRRALQDASSNGRESQVPGGQEDRVGEVKVGEDVF